MFVTEILWPSPPFSFTTSSHPPRRVTIHPRSPPLSPHVNSSSYDSSNSSYDSASSQPRIATMSGTNVGNGNLGVNEGSPMGGTSSSMAISHVLLPYMASLSIPYLGQLINNPLLHS